MINHKKFFWLIILISINFIKIDETKMFEINLTRYIKKFYNKILIQNNFASELNETEKYISKLKNGLIEKINYDKEINKPIISILVSVYNKENYLNNFLLSIQNQLFEEYELIIVDDFSNDRSIQIIQNFEKIDKRIKFIRNQKNYGSLYARYIGAIHAKGKYFIFFDSDDIVLKKILFKLYKFIQIHNIDIIEFHPIMYINQSSIDINRRYYHYNKKVIQPYLSYIFYYYFSFDISEQNTALWNKLIKKDVILLSFKYIGYNYLREKIIIENDVILLFSFFQNSKSYQYIDEIGYLYFRHNNSISKSFGPHNADEIIHSVFFNLRFLFEKTNKLLINKSFCLYKLWQIFKRYKNIFQYITNEKIFALQILNNIENSEFISDENKNFIQQVKLYINKSNIYHI